MLSGESSPRVLFLMFSNNLKVMVIKFLHLFSYNLTIDIMIFSNELNIQII